MNTDKINLKDKPLIGISVGDINGIGPEIILKTFIDNRIYKYCTAVVFCSKNLMNYYIKMLNLKNVTYNTTRNLQKLNSNRLNLYYDLPQESKIKIEVGKSTEIGGEYAYNSLQVATNALKAKKIDALVTAPINKNNIQSEKFKYPGHTEFLMDAFGVNNNLMLMVSDTLRVAVQTGHIPLKDVSANIKTDDIVRNLQMFSKSLEIDFNIRRPKIAVLGLNPHAGEEGLLGSEENEVIIPAINIAKEKGINALGPYPSDGFFGTELYNKFDGILAMYHDQGLIAFKILAFESGVNFTAGLPAIRTSPAHGTGFNIAGKGVADESSFREAIYRAIKIIKNRELYEELNENPLKSRIKLEREKE